jgi:hypothetical protein
MFARIPTLLTFLMILAVASLLQSQDAFGSKKGQGKGHGAVKVEFSATDDWSPIGGTLGQITCSDGEFTENPMQPCPLGTDIHVRGATAETWVLADDDRFTGNLAYTLNYNFNPDFAGTAWGTWSLEVAACEGTWEGVWNSKRALLPDPGPAGMGVWIGKIQFVGHGSGDCVDGLKVKGTEIATTYSPIPFPHEMLLPCDSMFCPAEGVITGEIKGPGRH